MLRHHLPAAVLGVACLALTTIAVAGTAAPAHPLPMVDPAPAPAFTTAGGSAADLTPELIQAMSRDLGISQEQAMTRLSNEETARRLWPALRAELGDRYAGSWMHEDGSLVVATTDAASTAVITAAGARASVVRRSYVNLVSMKDMLDATARTAPYPDAPVWFIDEPTNAVVVQALDRDAAREFVAASGVDPAGVRIETITERPVTFHGDVRGGDAYFINNAARCSVGFSVRQGGATGFVTAGHCGTAAAITTGPDGHAQGTFQASTFPGNDFAWVAVNADWTPRPLVNAYSAGQVSVTGSAEAPVGSSVCRSGSTTGWHCGVIQQRDTSVTYPQGTVTQVVRTSVCAEPGDSGGPYISLTHAQGVTSGGSGNCTSGGTTFFQPVNEILTTYGLALVTTPSACSHHANGYLAPLRAWQGSFGLLHPIPGYHPSSGGFTSATSGTHTGCLEGPGTARMRLSLEKWSCCGPFGMPIWTAVATAAPGATVKTLTTSQPAGTYRWVVSVDETIAQPGTPIGELYFLGTSSPS
jgi:streptogrisin C